MSTVSSSPQRGTFNLECFEKGAARMPAVLKMMGFQALREGQDAPIDLLMSCQDTIVILPTSTGKTAVFTIPTLACGFRTIVFSPLVALMRDQVQSLQKKGVRAASVSSMDDRAVQMMQLRRWAMSELDMLYVAPERLSNPAFMEAMKRLPPDMVVLDEAHTLSQWSDNFRSDYASVGPFIAEFNPKVVAALTATCPPEVEQDIRRSLGLPNAHKHLFFPRRKNLKLSSLHFSGNNNEMVTPTIANALRANPGPSLVYCGTIEKRLLPLASELRALLAPHGIKVGIFHGQLTPAEKKDFMDRFMNDVDQVMVCTNAFGMGVDKGQIRNVIHRCAPASLEALSQEIGRAGRDGKDSQCLTLFCEDSLRTQEWMLSMSYPDEDSIRAVYRHLCRVKDRDNVVMQTAKDIAFACRVKDTMVESIREFLHAHNVIETAGNSVKLMHVRYLDRADLVEDETFRMYRKHIERLGSVVDLGSKPHIAVNPELLTDPLRVAVATIKNRLREWDKAGLLTYVSPFRGTPIRVINDVNSADFLRWNKKRLAAFEKLTHVLRYGNTPNENKHDFLEYYFKHGSIPRN